MTSSLCPFRWAEFPRESIFATDPKFARAARTGRTVSQIASEATARLTQELGYSPGSIYGISSKGNHLIDQGNQQRRRKT